MIAWLLANPLARKLLLYAAVGAAILYGLRLWGNRQWQKGQDAGRLFAVEEITKAKQAEWAEQTAVNKRDAAKNAEDRKAIDALQTAMRKDLRDGLAAIKINKERNTAAVIAVPDSQLDSALRSISRELAANK